MKRLACLAVLAAAVGACSNREWSPVAATNVATGSQAASGAPAPTSDTYVSDSCGYPVRVDSDGKVKEIPLPGDRLKVLFPGFSTTMTNPATGKSLSFSSTGSFHIGFPPNGHTTFTYTGRNGYDDPFAGRLLFLIGSFSEEFDENFDVVSPLSGNGQIIDVCAKLAS